MKKTVARAVVAKRESVVAVSAFATSFSEYHFGAVAERA